jgi:hypothetical protein
MDRAQLLVIPGRAEQQADIAMSWLNTEARGQVADFSVFDDATANIFGGRLEHGEAEILARDVEASKGFEDTHEWKEQGVDLWQAWGRWRVNEGRTPADRANQLHEFKFRLRLDARPKHAAAWTGSLPANVVERGPGRTLLQNARGGQGVVVGNPPIVVFGDLSDRDAKAKKASIHGVKGFGDAREVEKIVVEESVQFWVGPGEGPTHDGANFLDHRGGEAGGEDCAAGGA